MPVVFLKSAFRPADLPESDKPQICMLGRSNVGKSSLINHLSGAKGMARVSARPGLTNAINLFEIDGRYLLVDLPGYGFSQAARSRGKGFELMLSDYLSEAKQLKLVLLIIDGRRGLMESDRAIMEQMLEEQLPFALVFNKTDKLSKSDVSQGIRKIKDEFKMLEIIPHSIKDTKGLGELRDVILRAVRGAAS